MRVPLRVASSPPAPLSKALPSKALLPRSLLALSVVTASLLGASCGDDAASSAPAAFPPDYAATYREVRDCRNSSDHDLSRVRVLGDAAAFAPYQGRDADFPVGSVVLKEEHDFADTDCSGPPIRWTLMRRLAAGSSPETLDWYWQQVDAERRVMTENEARCIGCHTTCGVPPDGYLGTCTVVGTSGGALP